MKQNVIEHTQKTHYVYTIRIQKTKHYPSIYKGMQGPASTNEHERKQNKIKCERKKINTNEIDISMVSIGNRKQLMDVNNYYQSNSNLNIGKSNGISNCSNWIKSNVTHLNYCMETNW